MEYPLPISPGRIAAPTDPRATAAPAPPPGFPVEKRTRFSFIVCCNNPDCYRENVVASLSRCGPEIELVPVDNRGNRFSVPEALNEGRRQAAGDVLVFCHQDVVFPPDWISTLAAQIRLVEATDPAWGVLGVMGVRNGGGFAGHIHDPHMQHRIGELPCAVKSLDEVCLILRRDCELRFDEQLGGYHFYGADLCLAARHAGLTCYAIDAPLRHLSAGRTNDEFFAQAAKLKAKWSRLPHSPRTIETTCGVFTLRDGFAAGLARAFGNLRRRVRRRLRWGR